MKALTVTIKKKKPKKTSFDIDKIHQHQLNILERFSAVYRLDETMKTLWEVVFRSGELIAGQIRLLRERTGDRWNRYSYWKQRRKLERELRK